MKKQKPHEQFRKEREDAGISQGEFAIYFGLKSYHTVSNWERGVTPIHKMAIPSLRTMIAERRKK